MNSSAIRKIAWIVLAVYFVALSPRSFAQEQEHVESKGNQAAGHSAAEGHTEPVPTHGYASATLNNPMEWRADGALFSLIVFLMLLAVLWAFAWKPIMHGLEKREKSIAAMIASAEKSASDAALKLSQYEAKLATASGEAQKLLADARQDAETAAQRILSAAQEEAARQRDRAVAEIDSAKRIALNELAGHSTDIAMSLAQRIVGRELRAEDHQSLVQEMLAKLPSRN